MLLSGFLLGGLPFLLIYFLLNKRFDVNKELSSVIPGGIILTFFTLFSILYLENPPYFMLTSAWILILFYIWTYRRKAVSR
jgi:hypothetical protein